MGLKLLNALEFNTPMFIKSIPSNNKHSIFLYPILLGMIFALAGTPCSTPILAGIMTFATIGKDILMAVIMLFLFALGQGLILIIAGLFASGLKNLKALNSFTEIVLKISGCLLIAVSLFLYWKIFSPLL